MAERVVVSVKVPESLRDDLRRQAQVEDRSASSIVRASLRAYLSMASAVRLERAGTNGADHAS